MHALAAAIDGRVSTLEQRHRLIRPTQAAMKVGFGGASKKQKKRAKKAAAKKDAKPDGDDAMKDVPNCTPEPAAAPAAAADGAPLSAKDKQRSRMELKRALKVQVASFKNKR